MKVIYTDFSQTKGQPITAAYVIEESYAVVGEIKKSRRDGFVGELAAIYLALKNEEGPATIYCDCSSTVKWLNAEDSVRTPFVWKECRKWMRQKNIAVEWRDRKKNPAHVVCRAVRKHLRESPDLRYGCLKVPIFNFRNNETVCRPDLGIEYFGDYFHKADMDLIY